MAEAEPIVESTPEPAPEAPAVAEAPQPTGYDWSQLRGSLPTEMREHTILDGFNETGLEGLVSEHINLQRLVGGEKVTKPTEKSPPEDWDRYYDALGRPKTVDEYDLDDFEPPEGLPWDGEVQTKMLAEFHKAGLSNKQASEILRGYSAMQSESYEGMKERIDQAGADSEQELKAEWGTAFDANSELAKRAFRATFGDSLDQVAGLVVDGRLLGDHPVFIKAFHGLGSRMAEDGFAGSGPTSGFAMTPDQAISQIAEMEASREVQKALVDKGHPEHAAVRRKHDALYRAAYPEEG